MGNLLLEKVEYKKEKTSFGEWRRYVYPTGMRFEEFRSHKVIGGLPLLHYTNGICPETGKRIVAKGIIAIGRLSAGVVAIGQASFGLIALGQLAIGLLLGLGQASSGIYAVGQLALGVAFGLGQFATGYTAIAQFAFGKYVLAQMGAGAYAVTPERADPEALEHFSWLIEIFKSRN
jgi:hypothetical protein